MEDKRVAFGCQIILRRLLLFLGPAGGRSLPRKRTGRASVPARRGGERFFRVSREGREGREGGAMAGSALRGTWRPSREPPLPQWAGGTSVRARRVRGPGLHPVASGVGPVPSPGGPHPSPAPVRRASPRAGSGEGESQVSRDGHEGREGDAMACSSFAHLGGLRAKLCSHKRAESEGTRGFPAGAVARR